MTEKPKQVEPKQWRAIALVLQQDTVHEIRRGDEKACVEVAVAEQEQQGREQNGERQDDKQGGDEPGPYGQGKPLPLHALAAEPDDGGEGVDGAHGGRDGEHREAEQPKIQSRALTGAGEFRGGQGRVARPAGDRRSARDKKCGQQDAQRQRCQPHAGGIQAREGHAIGADLCGKNQVAEAGLRGHGHDEKQHHRAVHRDQGEVLRREDGAVQGQLPGRPGKVQAHDQRENRAQCEGHGGNQEVTEPYAAVVCGKDSAKVARLFCR